MTRIDDTELAAVTGGGGKLRFPDNPLAKEIAAELNINYKRFRQAVSGDAAGDGRAHGLLLVLKQALGVPRK